MPSKQLFRGLFFCFYPQPSLYKINGLKAKAAVKFGAAIETSPSRQTTHILVARESVNSKPFTRFVQTVPSDSNCAIVSNEWCSQCIDAGKLLDTAPFKAHARPSRSPSTGVPKSPENDGEPGGNEPPVQSAPPRAPPPPSPPPLPAPSPLPPPIQHSAPENEHNVPPSPRKRVPESSSSAPASPSKRTKPVRAHRENAHPNIHLRSSPSPPPLHSRHGSPLNSPPSSPVEPEHPNQRLLDVFSGFVSARQATGDEFSARAYERALKVLQGTSSPVLSYEDAAQVAGLTPKMARLVENVLNGVLPDSVQNGMKQRSETLKLFATVYGVGSTRARALYEKGYRTLKDIEPHVDDNGRYSITHHADFVERMARSEVDLHYQRVKDLVREIDADVQAHCMGSYRRGEPDCGDIDIVLTREGASIQQLKKVFEVLLKRMFAEGLATHTFSTGPTRWLGASNVIGKVRRMDILLVPWQELGAAMIYYTGNSVFNRELRLSAIKQSMRLNEKGLYRVEDGGAKELIEGHDERRIFTLLGWAWREPHERRFSI